MPVVIEGREMALEEIGQALGKALGPTYQIGTTLDGALEVTLLRFPLVNAKVRVKWYGDKMTFQVIPGEVWILQGINALTIAPKLRHTLRHELSRVLASQASPNLP